MCKKEIDAVSILSCLLSLGSWYSQWLCLVGPSWHPAALLVKDSEREPWFWVDTLKKNKKQNNQPAASSPFFVHSLRPCAAAHVRGRHLAGAGLVVLQALQDALGQKLDIGVRLRVCVDQLQLLQAALLQQHAAVASGCEDPKAFGGRKKNAENK